MFSNQAIKKNFSTLSKEHEEFSLFHLEVRLRGMHHSFLFQKKKTFYLYSFIPLVLTSLSSPTFLSNEISNFILFSIFFLFFFCIFAVSFIFIYLLFRSLPEYFSFCTLAVLLVKRSDGSLILRVSI